MSVPMKVCVIQPWYARLSETFIRAHIDYLPADVTAVHGRPPRVGDVPILSDSVPSRFARSVKHRLTRGGTDDRSLAYEKILRSTKADAVLAEYGIAGVEVMRVCQKLTIPLVVHFHGYDACRDDVIKQYSDDYKRLFACAHAIVAVSRVMREQLISLGAPAEKVFFNPCGVDCGKFSRSEPSTAPPTFLAVGRFVQKKAPHLLLLAFAQVQQRFGDARLRMIGDGPLLGVCRDLASAMNIDRSVEFLGSQPHAVVQEELSCARAFVQHSVVAEDGDSEGTPVSILEAGASGIPVISTYHAGIPDVVQHEVTGLLVRERDVQEMATQMMRLLQDPRLADDFGNAARERITHYFRMEKSIGRLAAVIESCVRGSSAPPVDHLANCRASTLQSISV